MPIRNSKVSSEEAFSVHRKARLSKRSATKDRSKSQDANEVDDTEAGSRQSEPEAAKEAPLPPANEDHSQKHDAAPEQGRPAPAGDEAGYGQEEKHSVEGSAVEPESDDSPVLPRQKAKPGRQKPRSDAGTGQVRLQMIIAYPKPGASATFDNLVEMQGKKVAFRLFLGKALELYAAAVIDGTIDNVATTYPEDTQKADTSRVFSKEAYDKLSKTLDPAGLLPERVMATTIARRALAAFIAANKGSI